MSRTRAFLGGLACALSRSSPAFASGGAGAGPNPPLLVALRRDGPAYGRGRPRPAAGTPCPACSPTGRDDMVGLLLSTLALRDPDADRHAAAVADHAVALARAAGLSEEDQAMIHTAGLMHDIGRQALPDHILLGRSELHPGERELIERHPVDGARLLFRVEALRDVAEAVLAHHERVDGTGYPNRLVGDEIPIAARILAVAEVYDTLTASSSYRLPLTPEIAQEELRAVAGSQLDARLVRLFLTEVLTSAMSPSLS